MTVCIIPARGGSKGIEGKNLQHVGGMSLLARAVRTGLAAVGRVVVSTDDDSIAGEAINAGAEVVIRPDVLAEDDTPIDKAILHAVQRCDPGEWFAVLQCTSPFATSADLIACCDLVKNGTCDVAFAAARFKGHLWVPYEDVVTALNFDPSKLTVPSEARPTQWLETGAVYAHRTSGFLASGGRKFYGRIMPVELASWHGVDIDDPSDLRAARWLADGASQPTRP